MCSKTGNVLEKSVENKFPQQLFEVLYSESSLWKQCPEAAVILFFLRNGMCKGRKAALSFSFANQTVSQV